MFIVGEKKTVYCRDSIIISDCKCNKFQLLNNDKRRTWCKIKNILLQSFIKSQTVQGQWGWSFKQLKIN